MIETICEIPLTQGQVALVDAEDYESLNRWSWFVSSKGYARRTDYTGGQTVVSMHRQIMGFPDSQVDHINGDKLDNRRSNLRLATHAQNSCNKKKYSNNSSGVIGVSWHKPAKKWLAQIRTDGRSKHLGYYTDIFLAMMAVDAAKIKYHGEFARTNLPESYYSNIRNYHAAVS